IPSPINTPTHAAITRRRFTDMVRGYWSSPASRVAPGGSPDVGNGSTMSDAIESTESRGIPAGMGVLAATCISTLVVNANTSAVTILLTAIADDLNASVTPHEGVVT